MKIKAKYLLPVLLILVSCSNEPEKSESISVAPSAKIEPKDFYKFKHLLPESEYAYDIEITTVDFKNHKNSFTTKKEKYDAPTEMDGLTLNIKFKMTNPYNKVMQIPFPDYFYVTSKEFDGLEKFSFSKGCWCHSNSSTEIKNEKGKDLYDFTKRSTDGVLSAQIIEFKPNETQVFTISFSEPFPAAVKSLTFVGFNQHLYKQVDYSVYEKMSESEREATEAKSHGLVINIASKKIIDRTIMKR
jgi:hypothetical protein